MHKKLYATGGDPIPEKPTPTPDTGHGNPPPKPPTISVN